MDNPKLTEVTQADRANDMLLTVWRHGTPTRSVVKDLIVQALQLGRREGLAAGSNPTLETLSAYESGLRDGSKATEVAIVEWLRGQAAIYNDQNPNLSVLPEWTLAQKWSNAIERQEYITASIGDDHAK